MLDAEMARPGTGGPVLAQFLTASTNGHQRVGRSEP
jgi:hypothetical protein